MTIEISAEIAARLKAKAQAEGLSVEAYVEHLVVEEDTRRVRLAGFSKAINARLESPPNGETVDGEEVMARLIGELDEERDSPRAS